MPGALPRPGLRRAARVPAVSVWVVVLLAFWAAALLVFEWLRVVTPRVPETLCLFRRATGVPCPTCGTTRAVRSALSGHPLEALAWNPLVVTLAAVGLAWLGLRVVSGRTITLEATAGQMRVMALLLVALLLTNWAWVIYRHVAG